MKGIMRSRSSLSSLRTFVRPLPVFALVAFFSGTSVPSPANGHTIGHGQYANGYVDWVNGAIDDVRLYQAALSPDDILAIACIGNPSLPGPQQVEPATSLLTARTRVRT
jgi:hypothetical protein